MTGLPLAGWAPIRFYWQQDRPTVDWAHLRGRRFTEPFFNDTIERCLQSPFALLFRHQTPVETLLEWQERQPGVVPTGFIFHGSRCGSTLVSQMLSASPRHIVLSEPGPLDGVLDARGRGVAVAPAQRCAWLRALLSALGQRWGGDETRLFIKFDSWHTLQLPLLRQAFPEVPWIFLYRDPVEVLVSQMRQRGAQMVPGMVDLTFLGIALAEAVRMPPEEYCARVLAGFFQTALAQHREGGLLVNYADLPDAVWTEIAGFFRFALSAAEIEAMRAKTEFDAKMPSLFFTADRARKQSEATELIRQQAATWLEPLYAQLEAERRPRKSPA